MAITKPNRIKLAEYRLNFDLTEVDNRISLLGNLFVSSFIAFLILQYSILLF